MRIGIAGAAGYTAGELIRVLLGHPEAELCYLQSESHRGMLVGRVHTDLIYSKLVFSDIDFQKIDVLFLCMGHGFSTRFIEKNRIPNMVKIVDMGNDFRLTADAGDFVYGLPELNRERIKHGYRVANPGCFATAIELGLLPLAKAGALPEEVSVFGITGSTGAGQQLSLETHFSQRNQNLSVYRVFTHQHLSEIRETLQYGDFSLVPDIAFVPARGCHSRGIMVNTIFRSSVPVTRLVECYKEYYSNHLFTVVSDEPIFLKQVVNTNYCFIHLEQEGNRVLVTSVLDNLLKGASGQAVQNMNLLFGLQESTGLHLKAGYF